MIDGLARERLAEIVRGYGEARIAVSGGVDSTTLMAFAHSVIGHAAVGMHAASPAVPTGVGQRLRDLSDRYGWMLEFINANEMNDQAYIRNPLNRCYFCKSNLYHTISIGLSTNQVIFSGTNVDDLGDFRPGLIAASEFGVRHPFVEAGMGKSAIRALARDLGLTEIAQLPASPCLSSRISTGIPVHPKRLKFIDVVEDQVLRPRCHGDIRLRIDYDQYVVQLEASVLTSLDDNGRSEIMKLIHEVARQNEMDLKQIVFAEYRRGFSFKQEGRN